jgi:hypothetical protein
MVRDVRQLNEFCLKPHRSAAWLMPWQSYCLRLFCHVCHDISFSFYDAWTKLNKLHPHNLWGNASVFQRIDVSRQLKRDCLTHQLWCQHLYCRFIHYPLLKMYLLRMYQFELQQLESRQHPLAQFFNQCLAIMLRDLTSQLELVTASTLTMEFACTS